MSTALLAVAAVAATAIAIATIESLVIREATIGRRRVAAVTAIGQLGTTLVTQIVNAERFLADRSAGARNQFRAAADSGRLVIASLAGGLTPEADRSAIANLNQLQSTIDSSYSSAFALVDQGRFDEARVAGNRARAAAGELTRVIAQQAEQEAVNADSAWEAMVETARTRELLLAGGLVLLLGAGIAIARDSVVAARLAARDLIAAARRIGDGDLRAFQVGAMPGEFAELAQSIGQIGDRLRSMVGEIVTESGRLAATAGDLSAISQEIAASAREISTAMGSISTGAARQVSGLEQSQAEADRLGTAARASAEVAGRVAQLGAEIHRLAAHHQKDVAAAAATLLGVGEVVQATSTQVEQLERRSESIDEFVDLIKRISSQTNLLALNAAIEAARAGERGQGFAVVAEEVQRLADSSAQAAGEVTETVKTLRRQMADAGATMATGRAKVRGIEQVAQGAAGALQEIARAVSEVEGAAKQVSEEAVGNLQAAQAIRRIMREVSEAAETHAAASEEVTAATETQNASTQEMAAQAAAFNEAAERLKSLVQGFRL